MEKIIVPEGFLFAGIHSGIKKQKEDLALFYCKDKCNAAGVFTKNSFKAAPVKICEQKLKNGEANVILVNSGIANAVTGEEGVINAKIMVEKLAEEIEVANNNVLVCSTGIIGKQLPMEKIINALPKLKNALGNSKQNVISSAKGILTTDKKIKIVSDVVDGAKILAIGKGSGMLNPNMATMLCFFFTDAKIGKAKLKKVLNGAVGDSLNQISIDGCESTNDSAIIFSNQKGKKIDENKFSIALKNISYKLAKLIVEDAEGSEKIILVTVKNAINYKQAKVISKKIVLSDLVKTCVHGCDPNIGRIISAIGDSSNKYKNQNIKVSVCGDTVFDNETIQQFDKDKLAKKMKKSEITIGIDLKQGEFSANAFGCDLTEQYVKFNSKYST